MESKGVHRERNLKKLDAGIKRPDGNGECAKQRPNERLALAGGDDFPAQYESLRELHRCD